jgi:hypothetical protein
MIALYLGIAVPPAPDDPDSVLLGQISLMMDDFVRSTVPQVRAIVDPAAPWPEPIQHAAIMQAARIFTRRRSPTGVATYRRWGGPYTPRVGIPTSSA